MTGAAKQKQGPCAKILPSGPHYQCPRSRPTCLEVLLCPFVPEGKGERCMAKLDQEGSIRQPPQRKGGNVLSGPRENTAERKWKGNLSFKRLQLGFLLKLFKTDAEECDLQNGFSPSSHFPYPKLGVEIKMNGVSRLRSITIHTTLTGNSFLQKKKMRPMMSYSSKLPDHVFHITEHKAPSKPTSNRSEHL